MKVDRYTYTHTQITDTHEMKCDTKQTMKLE